MKTTINLLPRQNPDEARTKRKRQVVLFAVIGSFILLFGVWAAFFINLQILKSKEERLVSDKETKEQSIRDLADSERLYKNVYNKAAAALSLLKTQMIFAQRRDTAESVIGDSLTINDISLEKDKIKVSVLTTDIATIMQYLHNLEDENQGLKIFKTLTLSSILINSQRGYEIKIEGELAL